MNDTHKRIPKINVTLDQALSLNRPTDINPFMQSVRSLNSVRVGLASERGKQDESETDESAPISPSRASEARYDLKFSSENLQRKIKETKR